MDDVSSFGLNLLVQHGYAKTDKCECEKRQSRIHVSFINLVLDRLLTLVVIKQLELFLYTEGLDRIRPLLESVSNLPARNDLEKAVQVESHEEELDNPFVVILPSRALIVGRSKLVAC